MVRNISWITVFLTVYVIALSGCKQDEGSKNSSVEQSHSRIKPSENKTTTNSYEFVVSWSLRPVPQLSRELETTKKMLDEIQREIGQSATNRKNNRQRKISLNRSSEDVTQTIENYFGKNDRKPKGSLYAKTPGNVTQNEEKLSFEDIKVQILSRLKNDRRSTKKKYSKQISSSKIIESLKFTKLAKNKLSIQFQWENSKQAEEIIGEIRYLARSVIEFEDFPPISREFDSIDQINSHAELRDVLTSLNQELESKFTEKIEFDKQFYNALQSHKKDVLKLVKSKREKLEQEILDLSHKMRATRIRMRQLDSRSRLRSKYVMRIEHSTVPIKKN